MWLSVVSSCNGRREVILWLAPCNKVHHDSMHSKSLIILHSDYVFNASHYLSK